MKPTSICRAGLLPCAIALSIAGGAAASAQATAPGSTWKERFVRPVTTEHRKNAVIRTQRSVRQAVGGYDDNCATANGSRAPRGCWYYWAINYTVVGTVTKHSMIGLKGRLPFKGELLDYAPKATRSLPSCGTIDFGLSRGPLSINFPVQMCSGDHGPTGEQIERGGKQIALTTFWRSLDRVRAAGVAPYQSRTTSGSVLIRNHSRSQPLGGPIKTWIFFGR